MRINNTGSQWKNVDSKYPTWQTIFYYFTQLKKEGIWGNILDVLVVLEREKQQKESTPSLLVIDSHSVKIVQFTFEKKGIDCEKLINGRKRIILVDTIGLP